MNGTRVLVVEDERIIALTLRHMLEERGYTVVGAVASAQAAVRHVESSVPDIVLMDIHLEGPTDGIEAARQITAGFGTPILFLTAFSEEDTIHRASQCHAYGYLVKPIQAAELHANIQIAIAKHSINRRLHLALDASSLAVWDWNADADRVETTGNIAKLLDADPDAAPTLQNFLRNILPEDKPSFDAFIARTAGETAPAPLVFRYRGDNATIRWLESFARSYREPRSGTAHTVGTLRDITAQRGSEASLRQAAALFENLADAVAITTPDHRITAANPAFSRITGFTESAAIELTIAHLLSVPNPAPGPWQGESRCLRHDGSVLPVWLTITPVIKDESVTSLVYSFSDISPLRRAQDDLDFLAHHDALTGLPNRLHFHDEIIRLTALPTPFSVFYIDLDHFKLINDSRGHNTGDLVLQAVAGRIRGLLDKASFAARLGGDEFVVVTPAGRPEFAHSLTSTIARPIPIAGEFIVSTASVGSSQFPADGVNSESLLLAADTAMYAAKREGPNSFRSYSPDLFFPNAERYEIEQGIRRAFDSSELEVLYQPTVSLLDGRISGAEALVRWRHPELGLLNPDRFVPIVEAAGLIDQLGEAVLRLACRDWAAWPDARLTPLRLSINVSARQMTRGNFPALLFAILREFDIPAASIEVEITESSLQALPASQRFISDIKSIGAHIAIDDFGTGYSHLAALRHLPVDRIKLDRAFLPLGPPRPNDVALLNAIVAIARALNLHLTAEGIETIAQVELVRGIGCQEAQGFWFSHPLPFQDLKALCNQRPFEFTN